MRKIKTLMKQWAFSSLKDERCCCQKSESEKDAEVMIHDFFGFLISSLSACSLWLWHYLNAVCTLNYM